MKSKYDVFISYSRKDQDIAKRLHTDLNAAGLRPWIDDVIQLGESWEKSISDAINASDAILVIASKNTFESEWVRTEVEKANKSQKPIIPFVVSEEFQLPNILRPYDYIFAYPDYENAIQKVGDVVRQHTH